MTNKEQVQQQYLQFQQMQQQIGMLTQHTELLNQQIVELEISITALEEIQKAKIGDEILAPIANGIFVKVVLKENLKMIVNIGSNITVEKSVSEVIKLLEEHKTDIAKKIVEVTKMMDTLQDQAMHIFKEVEAVQ